MDNANIENIVKKSGSSFYLAMKVLPKYKRLAMYAIYAYCRIIDDIADGEDDYETKIKNLNFWRNEIDNIYKGSPETELGKSLLYYVKEFQLDKDDFLAVIDGMEMDLPDGMVAPNSKELSLYCNRVAGAVGLLSIKIFGESDKNARELAINLGDALQLTNIIRDVKEDAEIGRVYIPKEMLQKANIRDFNPDKIMSSLNLTKALELLTAEAKEKYLLAESNFKRADFSKHYPAFIMMKVYKKILLKIEKKGFNVTETRVKPNLVDLLAIVMETFIRRVLCQSKKPSI